MRTSELLARLKDLQVRVWADGAELRLSAPRGALTADLKQELVSRKQEILSVLAAAGAGAAPAGGADDTIVPSSDRPASERPLSFTQQRLWFLQRLDPELAAYNIPMSWTLSGPLDADALERAVRGVARRHEVLRTYFPTTSGRPYPQVAGAEQVMLERVDRPADVAPDDWRARVVELLQERAAEPFDLAAFPLFRPLLVELGPDAHVLFCLVHHAVFDGGSIARFLTELRALYAAELEGRVPDLSEPPVQYADYAAWQRAALSGPSYERELSYWREALAGELPALALPFDHPRPAVQTFRGTKASRRLSPELMQRLGELAGREGASLFMLALAAYKALLARYTGSDDVVVAAPIAGRERPELAELIGFFANTLVLRTRTDGDPTFRELLARVRTTCLEGFDHQAMPFERLVDELAPQRDLSYTPLFQTLFLIEEGVGLRERMGPVEVTPFELETRVARSDLMVYLYRERSDGDERWSVWAEYNTDLFERETVETLLGHYVRVLEAVCAASDTRLSALPLLDEDERTLLLETWGGPAAPIPPEPVHRQFEACVDRDPAALALVFPGSTEGEDERVTYAELDARANRLARQLLARGAERGAGPGGLVGLCLERSAEMVVAQLAILKTGAAYVPLDPAFPAERLAYMVDDAGLALVVTTAELAPLARGSAAAEAVCIDTEAEAIAAQAAGRPQVPGPPDDMADRERAYVIYTSGSTGRPKGVELEHRSVSNFLASMAREPGFGPGDSILAVTTLSFDIAVLELLLPLVTGGTTIVAPRAATASGAELRGLLERLRPGALQATPSTWRMLLQAGWEGDPELRALCGGEALPLELARELAERAGELWNLYGPTETTVWSTLARVEPGVERVSIGRPLASTRVRVLDRAGQPVPVGVAGELWIGGAGLARGYLGRPELTAERFRPDPFVAAEQTGGEAPRMYRTGDLARWRRDGTLECLGRLDGQVKLRGYRIELGEVEALLAAEPAVGACAAIVREDVPGDQRLVAYCTPVRAEAAPPEVELLRARARAFLPGYMVPQGFVVLPALPLTPNGKVDRRALRALPPPGVSPGSSSGDGAAGGGAAPRSELERGIAETWRTALRVDRVPIDASFFDLGGHSLLLAEVQVRLQEELQVDVSIVEMFQYPTVAGLAAHLERGRSADDGTDDQQRRRRSRNLTSGRRALRQRRGIRE